MPTLVVSLAAHAVVPLTAEIGSDQITSGDADYCYKLDVIHATQTVRLVTIAPYVAFEIGHDGADRLYYVVYEEEVAGSNDWTLLWDSGLVGPIGTLLEAQPSPNVNILLNAGTRYAIGFLLEDGNYVYEYEDPGVTADNLTWGTFVGAVWTAGDALQFLPDPLVTSIQNFDPTLGQNDQAYHLEITVEVLDGDGDGVVAAEDCDDADASRAPGLPEYCDGIDNDCTDTIDDNLVYTDAWTDADGDGYGDPAAPSPYCEAEMPAGLADDDDDCDDGDTTQNPGASEVCNGEDDDCDGTVDDGLPTTSYWTDADGDGYGDAAAETVWCDTAPAGTVTNAEDCDDTNAQRFPGNEEACDGIDNDCDGLAPSEDDFDSDGFLSCEDCGADDPDVYPGAEELCDGLDRDCDGYVPEPLECDPAPVEGLTTLSSCDGCTTPGGPVPPLAPLALLALARRRRNSI